MHEALYFHQQAPWWVLFARGFHPSLRPCFTRHGPQTSFWLSRAIHRASSSLALGSLIAVLLFIAHCGLSFRGPEGPTPLKSSSFPAKPKRRFTMVQRCRQFQLGASFAIARCAMRTANRPDWRKKMKNC